MRRILLTLLGLSSVAACDTRDGGGDIVRDSAGIRIVESSEPARGENRYEVDTAPLFDLGGGDGAEEHFAEFPGLPGRPAPISASVTSQGRVVVSDPANYRIRIFDAEGRPLHTIGRAGDGPGEFRFLFSSAVLTGDTIIAFDVSHRRFSWFDPSGKLIREEVWGSKTDKPGLPPVSWFSDGATLLRTYSATIRAGPEIGAFRDSAVVAVGDSRGVMTQTIGSYPAWAHTVSEGRMMDGDPMFGPLGFFAVWDTLIIVADNPTFGFDMYNRSGALVSRVRRAFEPEPVTESDITRLGTAIADEVGIPEPRRTEFLARNAKLVRMPFKPAFDRVIVATNHEVWLRHYNFFFDRSTQNQYSVFDKTGRWVTTATTPIGLDLIWVGDDRVIGVWREENDVIHVRAYAFTR